MKLVFITVFVLGLVPLSMSVSVLVLILGNVSVLKLAKKQFQCSQNLYNISTNSRISFDMLVY